MRWASALLLIIHSAWAVSAELIVAFGQSRPPFIDEVQGDGISFRLFDTVAKQLGWQYKPLFVSNRRMEKLLAQGQVDIAVEVQRQNTQLHYSQPFIAYSNYALHHTDRDLALTTIDQLQFFSICAWQNASQHLGIRQWTESNSKYREYPDQKLQVADWLNKRCDVLLIDDTLLEWHIRQLNARSSFEDVNVNRFGKTLLPVQNNPLWFYVGFGDAALRDAFDKQLSVLKQSGRYQQIRNEF
ncbi:transporter substrate-binding domain-containing protein [Aestuariibacter halophilus]|uniref:Transporter substrate-binding domain-containing protein n=1 Tax=Fluctibacter halophilus TaxID=226011 RepID=A0ABS8G252_9ALTE|nr:transporter substrate-binding domain-containing protein [Aestuariibacter halophilus]MCC2614662.1 transporter substrate-binding domain-containing protein [Aestuariibacter halophilus]